MDLVEAAPAVLLVGDDPLTWEDGSAFLLREGFAVRSARDGAAALLLAGGPWRPDVVVVDLLIPTRDAYTIYWALRTAFGVPVIVTTPWVGRSGAGEPDEILPRPFDLPQLAARIRTVLGHDQTSDALLAAGDLMVMPRAGRAFLSGRELRLTADEVALLTRLVAAGDQPVQKGDLLQTLRGVTRDTDPRLVDVHLVRLMVKLADAAGVRLRRTPANDAYVLAVTARPALAMT